MAMEARTNLYKLIAKTVDTSEPIQITSKSGNAVLVSEADWRAIQETIYLSGIPGMVESIKQAAQEPLSEGAVYDPEEEW